MRRLSAKSWRRLALGLLIALLSARVVYVAARLETAPGLLKSMFRDATLGWLPGWGHERIYDAPAERQFEFWSAEAERILSQYPQSDLAIGAAWMLNRPSDALQPAGIGGGVILGYATSMYRAHPKEVAPQVDVSAKVLSYAEMATRLRPDDATSWRSRAILVFESPFENYLMYNQGRIFVDSRFIQPRSVDWESILEEAKRHDPGNGLYDYLIVRQRMNNVGSVAIPFDARKEEQLKQAQAQPFSSGVGAAELAVVRLLEHTAIPRFEYPRYLETRLIQPMAEVVYDGVFKTLMSTETVRMAPRGEATVMEQWMRITEQLRASDQLSDKELSMNLQSQNAPLYARIQNSQVDPRLLARNWYQTSRAGRPTWKPTPVVRTAVSIHGWTLRAVLFLTCIAVGTRLLAKTNSQSINAAQWTRWLPRDAVAWAIALGATLAVLGLAPAGVIPRQMQQSLTIFLMNLLPFVVIATPMLWLFLHRKSKVLLIVVPLLGLLVALVRDSFLVRIKELRVKGLVNWVLGEFDFAAGVAIASRLIATPGDVEWPILQWQAHWGVAATASIAMLIVGGWTLFRVRKARDAGDGARLSLRSRIGFAAREVSRAAARAGVVLLLAWLATLPTLLTHIESIYDAAMFDYRELHTQNAELVARFTEIENELKSREPFREGSAPSASPMDGAKPQ